MLVKAIPNASLVVAAVVVPLAVATAADALDCPTLQPEAQPGVIQETADAAFSSIFAEDDMVAQVPKAIDAPRKRYPNAC